MIPEASTGLQTQYVMKFLVQKPIGFVPGLYRIQEFFKKKSGRWERAITDAFLRERIKDKVERFNQAGIPPPAIVLEQGTGWHGIDLALFVLAGAEAVYSYDTQPWLQPALFQRCLSVAVEHADLVSAWKGTDSVQVAQRAGVVSNYLATDWEQSWQDALDISYRVTRRMSRPEIGDEALDLVYSYSVLQRMREKDLVSHCEETWRMLKPGGCAYHWIDSKDFQSITNPSLPELGYLKIGETAWSLLTSTYLNYQNRLRMDAFVQLFQRHGFEVEIVYKCLEEENIQYAERHLIELPKYGALTAEDIAVSRFEMVARKPS